MPNLARSIPSRPGVAPADLAQVRREYLLAQLSGDRREALRVVIEQGIGCGASAFDVQVEVIQAAQREIGRLWQENQISIAEEHMATAISHTALAHLYDHAPRSKSNGKRVTVACVQGELHDFPARLVADTLDLSGFDVHYLGASVPTDSLLGLLLRQPPDLLALSTTMAFNVPALRSAVERIRNQAGGSLPILIGGGACDWVGGLERELPVDGVARSALEAVSVAAALLGVRA
jgi:methanogenic corrinoid protein MtbC1